MKIIFVVGRNSDKTFGTFFAPSAQRFGVECFQIGDSPDKDGNVVNKSINEKYNGMTHILLQNNKIDDETIVVYSHEDINITDNLFDWKLIKTFERHPDVGIVGVAGVKQISKDGWWFDEKNERIGQIFEGVDGENITKGQHVIFGPVGYYDNIAAVKGCVFAVRGSLLKDGLNFDIESFKNDRNMYAMDLCVQTLLKGYKVAVADVLIYHASHRPNTISDDWITSKEIFNEKYKDLEFPIRHDNIKVKNDEVLRVEI